MKMFGTRGCKTHARGSIRVHASNLEEARAHSQEITWEKGVGGCSGGRRKRLHKRVACCTEACRRRARRLRKDA